MKVAVKQRTKTGEFHTEIHQQVDRVLAGEYPCDPLILQYLTARNNALCAIERMKHKERRIADRYNVDCEEDYSI